MTLKHENNEAHLGRPKTDKICIDYSIYAARGLRPYTDPEYNTGELNMARHERELMVRVLNMTNNVIDACKLLKITEGTAYRKIFMHQLHKYVECIDAGTESDSAVVM